MAYLLFIPVIYYGTSHVANKIFNITSDYVLECEELHDESSALITAVKSVLKKYKDMNENSVDVYIKFERDALGIPHKVYDNTQGGSVYNILKLYVGRRNKKTNS